MNKTLFIKMAKQFLMFPIVMGTLLFLSAWTFDYWEAWVWTLHDYFSKSSLATIDSSPMYSNQIVNEKNENEG